jgi:hypothetical protein
MWMPGATMRGDEANNMVLREYIVNTYDLNYSVSIQPCISKTTMLEYSVLHAAPVPTHLLSAPAAISTQTAVLPYSVVAAYIK